eukprot:XP_001706936.1 Hypothetical protein GL50803_114857 [Giardia lamblia ATCC 50803]
MFEHIVEDGDGMLMNLPTGNGIESSNMEAEYSSAAADVPNKYLPASFFILSGAVAIQLSLCSS